MTIVEEGFYELDWVADITADIGHYCELINSMNLFCYYDTEEKAHEAIAKCYKRHILLAPPVIYNRALDMYRICIVCYPSSNIFELIPRGDGSGLEPILGGNV